MRSTVFLSLSALPLGLLLAACSRSPSRPEPSGIEADAGLVAGERSTEAGPSERPMRDARRARDAGPYEGPRIGAMSMDTSIMSDMEWPPPEAARRGERSNVVRLGYIRHGGKVPVIPEARKKPNCPEGWYELIDGGFVCGRYATLDLNHPRVRLSPHPPDLNGRLPYAYGYNLTNGTPLYRTVPSQKERLEYEPWLKPKAKAKRGAGGAMAETPVSTAGEVSRAARKKGDPLGIGFEGDGSVPWYLRSYDKGKPTNVTLDELRGEGPIVRRMVRGFFLSLDKQFTGGGARWWKTVAGFATPADRIAVQQPLTKFHGIWLNQPVAAAPTVGDAGADAGQWPEDGGDAGAPIEAKVTSLPVGFILSTNARKYTVDVDKNRVSAGEPAPRFTTALLTERAHFIGTTVYEETLDGWWMRSNDGPTTRPGPPPPGLGPGEKWIDVNLTNQTLVAFEGNKPVYATLVSSGKRDLRDKDKDHPTVTGSFRIREKHVAATMDGDVASDGPYSIEDVPWIMYFKGSYALHGAFWHADFGHMHSHGCVNLAPADAHALFGWTDPPLPEGWHGVYATDQNLGTRVIVHE